MGDADQSQNGGRSSGWILAGLLVAGLAVFALVVIDDTDTTRGAASDGLPDRPDRYTDASPARSASSSGEAPDAAGADTSSRPDPADLDLTGRWAHRSTQTSLAELPVGGEVEARTLTYRLSDLEHDGEASHLSIEVCETRIESDTDRVETRIPGAFVEAIPRQERPIELTARGGTVHLRAPRRCSVRGADLDDPAADPLPTSPDAPAVVDEDGDGHPGVTIAIEGMVSGELYLVQRGCDRFTGEVVSADRIRGTVDWESEQETLDSTSMFLGAKPPSRPHPDEQKSTFEMVRVDGQTNCEELMDDPARYFR